MHGASTTDNNQPENADSTKGAGVKEALEGECDRSSEMLIHRRSIRMKERAGWSGSGVTHITARSGITGNGRLGLRRRRGGRWHG